MNGRSCHDTAEVKYNPVTNRIEVIQSHRLGGGLSNTGSTAWVGHKNVRADYYREKGAQLSPMIEPTFTLNLWSISPDELLNGSADWRFDGTLLTAQGFSAIGCRDGYHPGGSIIDIKNNKQHIFIYAGVRSGPSSIFRLSRTLDTNKWRGVDPV